MRRLTAKYEGGMTMTCAGTGNCSKYVRSRQHGGQRGKGGAAAAWHGMEWQAMARQGRVAGP